MARYALIDPSNVVQNMVVWDGDATKWQPPAGWHVVDATGLTVDIGYTWNGGVSFTFGQLPSQILDQNRQTILQKLLEAETELSAAITNGQALLGVADYSTANLANLNDLLHKLQQVVGGPARDGTGGVMLIAQDLRWVARQLLGQFDGTT